LYEDIDEGSWLHNQTLSAIKDKLHEDKRHVDDGWIGSALGCLDHDVSFSVLLHVGITLR
jgi:hypothetical protein